MSKLSKLLNHPLDFVRDAIKNRFPTSEPLQDEGDGIEDFSRIPTFIFGFSPWKQFMRSWFSDRSLFFLPKLLKKEEFERQWKNKILATRNSEIFIWGFKVEAWILRFAESNNIKVHYVEDGFIRSIGLGASKTPPFSLSIDSKTPYFDARNPSDLEDLLNTYDFDADEMLMQRAERLHTLLLESGLSKYNHAAPVDISRIYGPKTAKRVLVVGQVEDDASIKFGCNRSYTNNDAVMIAAMENPGAQIIYKPHPDVLNGHRELRSNPEDVNHLCTVLSMDVPLAQAFETIDHVYTITSQAGFEALMRGIRVTTLGCPFYAGWGLGDDRQPNERRTRQLTMLQVLAGAYLLYPRYFDPVYKVELTAEQAVERLIQFKAIKRPLEVAGDEGRAAGYLSGPGGVERIPTYVFGFSPWKEYMTAWFPERHLIFLPKVLKKEDFDKIWKQKILLDARSELFIWGFKVEPYVLRFSESNHIKLHFVEDGFIRSIGLGATKTPPFSLTLDTRAPYFDARSASDLEILLNTYSFDSDPSLMARAERLMNVLLETGISKYNHAQPADINEIYGPRRGRRILVVGQVEDDASIKFGCERPYSNNDAVMIAAMENPGAQIIYKPHPDVLHGHRPMRSNPDDVEHLCLVLRQDVPLAQAFETVDHVYTITSQAGFEALMRGITVTTLGCPFYSGWGLTDDRQPNFRRTRQLTLLQVFAAAYLLYPRYFDPIHKIPLSAEQAVERLVQFRSFKRPLAVEAPALPAVEEQAVLTVLAEPSENGYEEGIRMLREEVAELRRLSLQRPAQDLVTELSTEIRALTAEIARLGAKIGGA